jgi:DNA-binding NtrC family response regulator
MQTRRRVLLICDNHQKPRGLDPILQEYCDLTRVSEPQNLQRQIDRGRFDVVFCAWDFGCGTWNAVLRVLQSKMPETPVVVFSQIAGEEEWLEVLEAGGFDLLTAPFRRTDVVSVLEHAASSYEGRRAHRLAGTFA